MATTAYHTEIFKSHNQMLSIKKCNSQNSVLAKTRWFHLFMWHLPFTQILILTKHFYATSRWFEASKKLRSIDLGNINPLKAAIADILLTDVPSIICSFRDFLCLKTGLWAQYWKIPSRKLEKPLKTDRQDLWMFLASSSCSSFTFDAANTLQIGWNLQNLVALVSAEVRY